MLLNVRQGRAGMACRHASALLVAAAAAAAVSALQFLLPSILLLLYLHLLLLPLLLHLRAGLGCSYSHAHRCTPSCSSCAAHAPDRCCCPATPACPSCLPRPPHRLVRRPILYAPAPANLRPPASLRSAFRTPSCKPPSAAALRVSCHPRRDCYPAAMGEADLRNASVPYAQSFTAPVPPHVRPACDRRRNPAANAVADAGGTGLTPSASATPPPITQLPATRPMRHRREREPTPYHAATEGYVVRSAPHPTACGP